MVLYSLRSFCSHQILSFFLEEVKENFSQFTIVNHSMDLPIEHEKADTVRCDGASQRVRVRPLVFQAKPHMA